MGEGSSLQEVYMKEHVLGEEEILAFWIKTIPWRLTLKLGNKSWACLIYSCRNYLRYLENQKPLEGDDSGIKRQVVLGRSTPVGTHQPWNAI